LNACQTAASKIRRRSILKTILDGLRADGRTIVFTNGCFDLLHVGHIRYLEAARSLGDCLVVGLNTDESVRRLKGEGRPLVSEFERAEVLASLQAVDYVTLFHEDTPSELISLLQPHIHVKGGDYRAEELPEAEAVQSVGGRIVILPITEGRSTTRLVESILENHGRQR
jgi:D-beta-D-heptose 7-phosphate kinase/D-beta-D-heptose 1-phosphate adenosyltransferase